MPEATDRLRRGIIVCNEGHSSSPAADTLRQLGLSRVNDLVGGYRATLPRPLPAEVSELLMRSSVGGTTRETH